MAGIRTERVSLMSKIKNTPNKRGRLSNQEKYDIQEMLNKKNTVKDICKKLQRTETSVQNYIDKELNKIKKTVKKVRTNKVKELEEQLAQANATVQQLQEEKNRGETVDEMAGWVTGELSKINGLEGKDVGRLVAEALRKNGDPPNKNVLLQWAMGGINARHLMGHKTGENKEGVVSIMTKAASERGDANRQSMPKTISRTARNNLFAPLDGKMIKG